MDSTISDAMLEANRRLYELRAQLGVGRAGGAGGAAARPDNPPVSISHSLISDNGNDHNLEAIVAALPPHLGWGSETLTKHLRKCRVTSDEFRVQNSPLATSHSTLVIPDSSLVTRHSTLVIPDSSLANRHSTLAIPDSSLVTRHSTLVAHPSITLAALRAGKEAPARVYLLLRAIDQDGRGWLTVDEARARLTGQDSPLRVAGWRRLRQLLHEGEGTFWRREPARRTGDSDRLWLNAPHRVAHALGVIVLQGSPVELPVESLLGGIQAVRATFYAAFHAGRDGQPISRATLRDLSGVAGRTQQTYDRLARVERRGNIAVGERYTAGNFQERAWRQGRAAFHFIDHKGRQGGPGGEYVAWTLPNSYRADFQRRSKGSRKRANRRLADLVKNGIPGNDERGLARRYFANGALAARRFSRDPDHDLYWRQGDRPGPGVWGVFAGVK